MRDQYLAVVTDRVTRAEADPTAVTDAAAMADAERLAGTLAEDEVDIEAHHILGWFYWYRAVLVPHERDAAAGVALNYFAVCFVYADLPMPEHLADEVVVAAVALVHVWTEQARLKPDLVPLVLSAWARIGDHLTPEHPLWPVMVNGTAMARYLRYWMTGDPNDLDEAVRAAEQAVDAAPPDHPDLYAWLSNLSGMLTKRFERRGDRADLDAAIAVGHRAADLMPPDDPTRGLVLSNLCGVLRVRFAVAGDVRDLNAAVDHGREAATELAGHPERGVAMVSLCVALRNRFERLGDLADLHEATSVGEAMVGVIPDGHLNRFSALTTLGTTLKRRYDATGAPAVLDRAIEVTRAAVASCSSENPERAGVQANLAVLLYTRSDRTGGLDELDEAITLMKRAVDAPDAAVAFSRTANLSGFLRRRYERTGDRAALDQAITWAHTTVASAPPDHRDRAGALSNLAACLDTRYEYDGVGQDLDNAVTAGRQAVAATPPDDPSRAVLLTVLANILRRRFGVTEFTPDLDEAISASRAAVGAAEHDVALRVTCLSNLGRHLTVMGRANGDTGAIDEAISCYRTALTETRLEDAAYAWQLVSLARTLLQRHGPGDEAEARSLVLAALARPVISPSMWVNTAALAAVLLLDHDLPKAADVLEKAVLLLPETASRRLDRVDQERSLALLAGLTSHAASLALSVSSRGDRTPAERALALLELGRGIMLSRTLDARDDVTSLRAVHPELATRFIELRDRVDLYGDVELDRHATAAALAALTAHIRSLDGFADFLAPPHVRELTKHADRGPIVVLNVSKYRADALLVRAGAVIALPLQGISFDHVRSQVVAFLEAQATTLSPHTPLRERIAAEDRLSELLGWLWDAIVEPVLEALGNREEPEDGAWPHVWWMPVGDLSLMPLHAAGHHRRPDDSNRHATAMDRVVSSYTPTIRALAHARQREANTASATRSMIVAMPTTDMAEPLAHVRREAETIAGLLPDTTVLLDPPPTKAAVLGLLTNSAVAHFACHSVIEPRRPTAGKLLLHDQQDEPLTVADVMAHRLEHAQLAYLSACRTAVVDATDLLDEVTHLTTAFQLAGYPHVVGTLWEINDPLAADIAHDFYANLTVDGRIDPSRSALALHQAVRTARDKLPMTPTLWAAHIHTGA